MFCWTHLIRFLSIDGRLLYGNAIIPPGASHAGNATTARVIAGNPLGECTVTDEVVSISQLQSPLAASAVGTIRCMGVNYARHALETNASIPTYPIFFNKPTTSLNGPFSPVYIPHIAQEPGLDYETELAVVIGKHARNVPEASALDYVAGYAVANDVTHRVWQVSRGGGQWTFGKGFDGFAPFGPAVVAARVLGANVQGLNVSTKVNGVEVQNASTRDMVFGVASIVSFLSQGTTLKPGDIILTGTPEGVGIGKTPFKFLQDGDIVEVSAEGIGSCINQIRFESNARTQAK